jgi:hypothetical protein
MPLDVVCFVLGFYSFVVTFIAFICYHEWNMLQKEALSNGFASIYEETFLWESSK